MKLRLSIAALLVLAVLSVSSASAQSIHIKDTGAGYKLGTAPTQLLGFYGAAPVPQQSGTNDLIKSLQTLGLLQSGTYPTPLGLHGGTLFAGSLAVGGTGGPAFQVTVTSGSGAPTYSGQPNGSLYFMLASGSSNLFQVSGTTWVPR